MMQQKLKRGRPEHLNKERAEYAYERLVLGIRVNIVCKELKVSRQVLYSAIRRYGHKWPLEK